MNKRGRDDYEAIDMAANCLMLLSKVGESDENSINGGRSFVCKTCNRKFNSFQALGGHRASHKKPKLTGDDLLMLPNSPPKPKIHECSICGLEFPIGQALGGHMRRHKDRGNMGDGLVTQTLLPVMPVLKKSNSSKRVMCLDLNLSLWPAEDDLSLGLGKVQNPVLKCFI
ncbi:zinc finger protein ZAT12 [Euphorbia lathyris]|uniref:zinc finger protein ZAT12 n=1 Tax=Euphorbia lathyris TaxID=212925 RepID=UPI003313F2B4